MSISTTSSSAGGESRRESDLYRTISASVVVGGRGTGGELPLLAVIRGVTTVSSSLEQLTGGEDRSVLIRLAAEGADNGLSSSPSFSSSSSSSSSSLLLLFDVLFLPKFNASLCSGTTAVVAVTIGPLYTGVRFRAVAAVYAAAAAAADGLVDRPAKTIIYNVKYIITIPYFPGWESQQN